MLRHQVSRALGVHSTSGSSLLLAFCTAVGVHHLLHHLLLSHPAARLSEVGKNVSGAPAQQCVVPCA